jgi:SAM-dependent methyltransferase
MTAWPYDQIARFYDQDMGLNADPKSIDWYLETLKNWVGDYREPVLELGCGTGRITLPIAASGRDVLAIDRSSAMLAVLKDKASGRGLDLRIECIHGDMTELGFKGPFSAVLCPFSVLAYILDDAALTRLLKSIRDCLVPGGILAFDMFVARHDAEGVPSDKLIEDYRRTLPAGEFGSGHVLQRFKRLTRNSGSGVTQLERFYEVFDVSGASIEKFATYSQQREHEPGVFATKIASLPMELICHHADFEGNWNSMTRAGTSCVVARRMT